LLGAGNEQQGVQVGIRTGLAVVVVVVVVDEDDDDLMYKRRKIDKRCPLWYDSAVGREKKELLPVERGPHPLHLLHSREVGPGGEDLPPQESTDSSHRNDQRKMERNNQDEGEFLDQEEMSNDNDVCKTATADGNSNNNKQANRLNTMMGNEEDDFNDDHFRKVECNSNEDEKTTAEKIVDPFFLRDPFTNEEFEEIQKHSKSLLVKSVESLEGNQGFRAFREWRAKVETVTLDDIAEREERSKEALLDAKIPGAPREYQERLFEIACQRNTIVHLGTGSGKTLIALMCIRHFASGFEQGKQTLFLVPSVALAVQQRQVLRANLPYKVGLACYATATTIKARQELQECNIMVATHGAVSYCYLVVVNGKAGQLMRSFLFRYRYMTSSCTTETCFRSNVRFCVDVVVVLSCLDHLFAHPHGLSHYFGSLPVFLPSDAPEC
jgi:DEAD/DEAH box helicase